MSCPADTRAELRVVLCGRAAARMLAGGRAATVIARFERSAYVANRQGLACLGFEALGRGPLNAWLAATQSLPPVGAQIRAELRGARHWRPDAFAAFDAVRAARALAALDRVRGRGLFTQAVGRADVAALGQWMRDRVRGRAPRAAAGLIGSGPGLTPAGDDLVGGAILGLRAAGQRAAAVRLAAWALRRARDRTNRISRAHLACAATGEGSEALHAFIAALLAGRRSFARELEALDAIGHSSGWDAAAGVRLALAATLPAATRAPAQAA